MSSRHSSLRSSSSGRVVAAALFLITVLLLVMTPSLFGQSITGDILGTVRDSTGAVVQGAKVTLTASDTGISARATVDNEGNYLFAQLKPGRYSVSISKQGFETSTVSNIDLEIGQRPRLDFALKVGNASDRVEVSAGGAPQLETETSGMGQILQDKIVQDLPIIDRNFIQLMTLTAGVAPIGAGTSPAATWTGTAGGTTTASVAGGRESNDSFLVDGIESRNARFGSANLRLSFDAIQEVEVKTNNFSSEYGRSGGVTLITVKSGTNKIHGDAFDYFRNDALNANDFFSNLNGQPRGELRYNNFGGSFSGPVRIPRLYNGTNKTFFFFNYEGFRQPTTTNFTARVPSAAQLAGNLADDSGGTGIFPLDSDYCQTNSLGTASAKCGTAIDPTTGTPFPGNVIPTGRLDPTSQKWTQFWALPNFVGPPSATPGLPLFNYKVNRAGYVDWDQYNVRIDHTLTKRDQIWGSFTYENRPTFEPGVLPLQGSSFPIKDTLVTATESHVFSPTVINEARFGYNRGYTYKVGEGALSTNYAQTVFGFKNTSANPFDYGVPNLGISNSIFNTPGSPAESIGALDQNFQYVDHLSVAKGKNSFKVGIDFMHEKFYQVTDFAGVPSVTFTPLYTGVSFADYLLGTIQNASASVGDSSQDLRSNYYGLFLQDDWHVASTLTLNLGIRYEFQQTPYDTSSKTAYFDPDPSVENVVYSRDGKVRNGIVDPDYNNVAPRVGFAWSPAFLPKTVLRGGAGTFYATDNWNELQFLVNAPDFASTQTLTSNPDPRIPGVTYSQLFPPVSASGGTSDPFTLDKHNRTPYVNGWNLDLQHTFGSNWLLDVGYIGNVAQKLPQRRNLDAPSFDPTGLIPISQRDPYPQFSWILLSYNGGWSSYHGLAVRAEKRLSSGWYFLASYTYSHALDLGTTDDFSVAGIDMKHYDKGNGDYDVRQRLVLSYVYDLPFGHGKEFLSNAPGVVDKIVGGWEWSGITTFSTGQYTSPSLPVDWINCGPFCFSLPDKVGNPVPAHRSYLNYFDINAFAYPGCEGTPTPYLPCANGIHVEGTARRNSLENPGTDNWDMSFIKRTPITRRLNSQFEVEAQNVFNHTQFGEAGTSLQQGSFGIIQGVGHSPRVLQLSLRIMF
jgi:outer membrane receptor protein involved in Fe transport